MHSDDEHLLIVRTIEDRDPTTLREIGGRSPEKVVLQFRCRRLLEAVDSTTLGIDAGHHMSDRAVLPRGVGRLKDQEYRVMIGRVVKLLHRAELGDVVFQKTLVLLLGFVDRVDLRRPLLEVDLVALAHPKVLRLDFHL